MTSNASGGAKAVGWGSAVVRLAVVAALVAGFAAWWLPRQGSTAEPSKPPAPDPTASLLAGCTSVVFRTPGEKSLTAQLLLEVEGGSEKAGKPVQLGEDRSKSHQRWWQCPTDSGYALYRPKHIPGMCMTEMETRNFGAVEIQPCLAEAAQQWRTESSGLDSLNRPFTALVNRADGRVIDLNNSNFKPGANVQVFSEFPEKRWDQLIWVEPAS